MIKGTSFLSPVRIKSIRGLNFSQKRTSFFNRYRHGPTSATNPKPDYVQWVKDFFNGEGKEFIKCEAKKVISRPFRSWPKEYNLRETYKFEDFDSDESIKAWRPVADSDTMNGYSTSNITRSQSGHALFSGILDSRVPDDGITQIAGYAGIMGPKRERESMFHREGKWDWSNFNHVEIKCRGDGRKYRLVVSTGSCYDDLSYYDNHIYPLHTRGGPYWQIFRIPFSKLIFSAKGLVQDATVPLHPRGVSFVAITISDRVDGPFALEIDYIGLRCEEYDFYERYSYESYTFPHIQYRELQVDCEPPDPSPQ